MEYIALFSPAIISLGIEYKKNNGENWNWFEYLYKYALFLICNVLLTESLISYILKMGSVTNDAFGSFPFFTKYLLIATVFAIILPYLCKIVRENISVSFEIHRDNIDGADLSSKHADKTVNKELQP